MEKKYLMLLPLAIPLFFGGKAAVTAIKKRTQNKENGSGRYPVSLADESINAGDIESDQHIEEIRAAIGKPELAEQMQDQPDENIESPPSEIEMPREDEIELPDEEELRGSSWVEDPAGSLSGSTEINKDIPDGVKVHVGPKGGRFYFNDSGKKVYLKK
jgi:hypothetical protein